MTPTPLGSVYEQLMPTPERRLKPVTRHERFLALIGLGLIFAIAKILEWSGLTESTDD